VCESEYGSIAPPRGLASPLVRAALAATIGGVFAIAIEPLVHADVVDRLGVTAIALGVAAAAAHAYLGFQTRSNFLANRPLEPRVPKE
jgi:hypothetical protein